MIVFPVVGYFTGWLVGESRSPIVSSLVPLVIGLLGAVAYSVFERKTVVDKLLKGVQDLEKAKELAEGVANKIVARVEGDTNTSWWLPALWCINILLFCGACYFGLLAGISFRVPNLNNPESFFEGTSLNLEDKALLHQFYFYCKTSGITETDYNTVMKSIANESSNLDSENRPSWLKSSKIYFESGRENYDKKIEERRTNVSLFLTDVLRVFDPIDEKDRQKFDQLNSDRQKEVEAYWKVAIKRYNADVRSLHIKTFLTPFLRIAPRPPEALPAGSGPIPG